MPKYWRLQALLAKAESTYGDDALPTGALNAILAQNVRLSPMEGEDVVRDHAVPWLGARPTIPAALHAKLAFEVELKGSGTAGTAPAFGALLKACAMAEVIAAGASVTYNPVSTGHGSATLYFNSDGTNYLLKGARGTFTLRLNAQGIPVIEFEFTGLFSQPSAVVLPTAVYGTQLTAPPQLATSLNTPSFTLGAVPLVLRQFSLAAGNQVETRFLIGSEAVIIPDRSETIEATVEAGALATWNPYALAAAQTTQALSLVHGTGAGKICTLAVPKAQIQRPDGLAEQQGVVEWALKLVPLATAGNDQFTLAFT